MIYCYKDPMCYHKCEDGDPVAVSLNILPEFIAGKSEQQQVEEAIAEIRAGNTDGHLVSKSVASSPIYIYDGEGEYIEIETYWERK